MGRETKFNVNEKNGHNELKTLLKHPIKKSHNKIAFCIYIINESLLSLLLSCILLRMYQFISCTLFSVIYITFKITNHLLCYNIFLKFRKFTLILIRIRNFIDDFLMLCYFLVFLSVNFIYTHRILKHCLYKLEPGVISMFFVGILSLLINMFLLSKIFINYIKDSYFRHFLNVNEFFQILVWRIRIMLLIYVSLFVLVLFFLQKTYFLFYILVSLFSLLAVPGIVFEFIYNNLNIDLSYYDAMLASFLFEIAKFFLFMLTVFNEFILATNEVDKVCYFYLFDKKAYVDEKTWAHDIINKYF
ncbi:hypothetical protein TUBRATIS_16110 [Tubulinosema ratisbonensis]|uniref:Uncharacterized protein n=1 Tax=Tubulinosema ratisbonensis TaxID=291195 RepID=A0A437ALR0_9MICR|nr:hypothetical protein TUBRATIS_16110 [Tubulinosema ratisbonensis]